MEYLPEKDCQIPELNKIYKNIFGYKKEGIFIEIGAFDGYSVSNTCFLADIGWKGYYIEPIIENYLKCKERHKNNKVDVLNYAIGDKNEKVNISVAGPLSTCSKKSIEIFKKMRWSKYYHTNTWAKINQKTMEKMLIENNISPNFDLLVIDVEGYEWKVLKNWNINKWNPKVVIIELHDENDNYLDIREECIKITKYFKNNNYKISYKNKINTVFYR